MPPRPALNRLSPFQLPSLPGLPKRRPRRKETFGCWRAIVPGRSATGHKPSSISLGACFSNTRVSRWDCPISTVEKWYLSVGFVLSTYCCIAICSFHGSRETQNKADIQMSQHLMPRTQTKRIRKYRVEPTRFPNQPVRIINTPAIIYLIAGVVLLRFEIKSNDAPLPRPLIQACSTHPSLWRRTCAVDLLLRRARRRTWYLSIGNSFIS